MSVANRRQRLRRFSVNRESRRRELVSAGRNNRGLRLSRLLLVWRTAQNPCAVPLAPAHSIAPDPYAFLPNGDAAQGDGQPGASQWLRPDTVGELGIEADANPVARLGARHSGPSASASAALRRGVLLDFRRALLARGESGRGGGAHSAPPFAQPWETAKRSTSSQLTRWQPATIPEALTASN